MSVPETGATREVTGEELRAELARGEITSDYWVWSPEHGDWKQIRELPTLWAAPAAIPVPTFTPLRTAAIPNVQQPEAAVPAVDTTRPLPVKGMAKVEQVITPVAAATAAAPKVKRKKHRSVIQRSVHVEDDDHFPWVKFLFEALYIGIAVVVGLNYIVVDKPLNETLAATPFVLVPVHAHMGSFVQPNAMVVHVLPSADLTKDNLPDFLQTLAASTPNQPFAEKPFEIIELTSGWEAQFSMSGPNWTRLGTMAGASSSDRRDFIVDHLCSISGDPLIHHAEKLGPIDLKAARDNTWRDFTAELVRGS